MAGVGDILRQIEHLRPPEFPKVQDRMMTLPNIPIQPSPLVSIAQQSLASEFHSRLIEMINGFDSGLDGEHEVGVRLVNFGQTLVFHLEDVGYWNPALITFKGTTEDGDPIRLIQHVSQISIALMVLPRNHPGEPKRPIGFHTCGKEDQPESR